MATLNLGISPVVAGQGLVFSGVTLNVNVANSVTIVGDAVQLTNDLGAPGNSKYYGTNAAGLKGWFDNTGSSGGGGTGDVTSAQLTATGVILGAKIDSLSGYSNGIFATIVNLATTGQTLWNATQGNAVNLSGQLTASGAALIARDTAISGGLEARIALTGQTAWTHGQNNAINLSGNLAATGTRLYGLITGASGVLAAQIASSSAGVTTLNGVSGAVVIASAGTGITVSNSGQTLFISGRQLVDFTGITLSGNGLTANSTVLYLNGVAISGGGSSSLGGVTGVNQVTGGVNITGAGNAIVTRNGQDIIVSGLTRPALSPGFTYATGGVVNVTVNPNQTSQLVEVTATGNVILNINGNYDGCNGTVVVYKTFGGTGSLTLPANAYIVNGLGAAPVMSLSTGASGYDVASFVYDNSRSFWAISTLSGVFSPVIINSGGGAGGGGTGTFVTVTGSSTLANLNVIAIGGALAYLSGGSTLVISGGAGAGGEVTQGQLDAVSGFFLTPPQVNLNGGTALSVNTSYYDGFNANRTLTFGGSPSPGSSITLRANISGLTTIGIPSSYRIGEAGTTTGLTFPAGNHEINWVYADNKWWLADDAGGLNNLSAMRGPAVTDDQRSGYMAGSQWLDASVSGYYVCLNAAISGAAWLRVNNPTGIFSSYILLNGQLLSATGSSLYLNGNLISGAGGSAGGSSTGGVTGINGFTGGVTVVGAGTSVVTSLGQTITVSGTTRDALSPRFTYATGGMVNLTVDPAKASQSVRVTATGDVILNINGSYDGANGTVIIYKTFGGTGSLTLPAGSFIINGGGATTMPLSTGASGYDVASYVYDQSRPYWAVSTLSGFASTSTATFTGNYTALTVTGSAIQPNLNVVAIGGALAYLSGANTLVISGGAGSASTGGSASQAQLSPGFTYSTGGLYTLTVDSTKATQDLEITATGNVILRITGVYDGCNGTIVVYKTFGGTGSLTLPDNAYIINGLGATVMPLSTGASGYDVASYKYDAARSFWAISTLSGVSSVSAGGGGGGTGTLVSVTGSSVLTSANLTGLGGVTVSLLGTTVSISGSAGGGVGDVTQAQLLATSGAVLVPPQVNLAGGTSLSINTIYYDGFQDSRTLSFAGSPVNSSFITLRANVTGYTALTIPTSYRIGQLSSVTNLGLAPGNQEISWIYADSKWWMADSAGASSNYGTQINPTVTDDYRTGYSIGSEWFNTGTNIFFKNTNSTSGAATWQPLQSAVTPVSRVTGNFTITGGYSLGYLWSGGSQGSWTGSIASASVLSGYRVLVKNITTGASLLVSGTIDYTNNYTVGPRQSVTLWSDNVSWIII